MKRIQTLKAYEDYSAFRDERIRLAQTAVALGNRLRIQLHDKQLVARVGHERCKNNGEALIDWLQSLPVTAQSDSLDGLAGRLIIQLTDSAS